MPFISYAQNFEDVLLKRCFGHLDSGFYIDIGADDPIIDSVTKSFYDHGWSGINIDPSENSFTKLQTARIRDINIQVAVDAQEGSINFWNVPKTGLSTAIEKFANQHELAGFEVNLVSVKTRSLKDICEEFVKCPINFMKIDVEGFEKQVLLGADFDKFRPMVILVESTEPNSQLENYLEWEYILEENKYQFCYGDGLNRFYLASESSFLKVHFVFPPSVFDKFVLSSTSLFYDQTSDIELTQQRDELTQQRDELTQQRDELTQQRDELTQQRDELTQQRDEIVNSTIWNLTNPLRKAIDLFKK
jgi:FkbM family methyltransferase